MNKYGFLIEVEGESVAESNILVEKLREIILSIDPFIEVEREKTDTSTMDFGSTLVVILGSATAVALAKGVQMFLAKYHSAKLHIKMRSGSVIAENLSGTQVIDLVKILKDLPQK